MIQIYMSNVCTCSMSTLKEVLSLIFYRSDGCIETWDLQNDWYQDKVSLIFLYHLRKFELLISKT